MLKRLGFHVSIAGGLGEVVPRAVARGCTAFQIFTSSPSQWARKPIADADAAAFRKAVADAGIAPVVVHAIYLLNLSSPGEELRRKSVACLADELARAELLGAAGVIFHLGSVGADGDPAEGVARLARSLVEARKASGSRLPLILENSAGAGALVGGSLDQIAEIIDRAGGAEPVALCLDTAHAFGAGIPIHEKAGLDAALGHPVVEARLAVVHANDSNGDFNSRRDRHWHVGKGRIGPQAFKRIVTHPRLRDVPLIMETPGTEDDDKANMRAMKKMLGI